MNKISFYPFSDKTVNFAPEPTPASRAVPDWYKKQPGTINEEAFIPQGVSSSTIKRCMPIFDVMTAGYLISFPCDIYIDATNPEKLSWSLPQSMKIFGGDMLATHAFDQYSQYPIDYSKYHKQLFRIMPFWAVKTPKGYSSLFLPPLHQDSVPFMPIGGLIDTDEFISDGHLSMLIEKDFKGVIKQGTPFIQVIPFKREPWEMEIIEPQESNKILQKQRLKVRSTFVNGYRNKMRSKKEWR
jgi:hypothetical protein